MLVTPKVPWAYVTEKKGLRRGKEGMLWVPQDPLNS